MNWKLGLKIWFVTNNVLLLFQLQELRLSAYFWTSDIPASAKFAGLNHDHRCPPKYYATIRFPNPTSASPNFN